MVSEAKHGRATTHRLKNGPERPQMLEDTRPHAGTGIREHPLECMANDLRGHYGQHATEIEGASRRSMHVHKKVQHRSTRVVRAAVGSTDRCGAGETDQGLETVEEGCLDQRTKSELGRSLSRWIRRSSSDGLNDSGVAPLIQLFGTRSFAPLRMNLSAAKHLGTMAAGSTLDFQGRIARTSSNRSKNFAACLIQLFGTRSFAPLRINS